MGECQVVVTKIMQALNKKGCPRFGTSRTFFQSEYGGNITITVIKPLKVCIGADWSL
jgi:hypothetical protein